MGFMDKAKELAAKAEQAVGSLDGPNPNRDAGPLFRDLGAKVFDREQGRGDERTDAEIAELLDRLRTLEAQAPGGRLATAGTSSAPPPPGAAAGAPPPPGAAAAPPPPGAVAAPPPPGAAAPSPPPPPPGATAPPPPPPAGAAPPPPPPPAGAVAPPPPPPPPGTI